MARQTINEILAEARERHRRVYNIDNPYGYELNVNNDVLKAWYRRYIAKLGNADGTEPSVRLEWECRVKALIKREYKKFYREDLREPVVGWTKTRVEELIIMLGVDYGKEMS